MPLQQFVTAAHPFVARALRGTSTRRYIGVALLLLAMSLMMGWWLALGNGKLERALRVGFKIEAPQHVRETLEYRIFADDEFEYTQFTEALAALDLPRNGATILGERQDIYNWAEDKVVRRLEEGFSVLVAAKHGIVEGAPAAEVQAVLERFGQGNALYRRGMVEHWNQDALRSQMHAVLDRGGLPEISLYTSALGPVDVLRLAGLIAGGLLLTLLLLFAPVLAGTRMAQEVHENTLQPLTGTALSTRELVVGMSVAPIAVVGLLAGPQALLLVVAAAVTGQIGPALGLIGVCLVGAVVLVMLAQLLGLALGRVRGPGLTGVLMLGILAPLMLIATLIALELPRQAVGFLALLPQASAAHLLFESFIPAGEALRAANLGAPQLATAALAVTLGTAGMLCFAYIALRALERRIGGLGGSAISRGEAWLGAVVSIALVTVSIPEHYDTVDDSYLLGLAILLSPFAVLAMMRTPVGPAPPLRAIVGEFLGWVALFFGVTATWAGADVLTRLLHPVPLFYLAWMVVVTPLLAAVMVTTKWTVLRGLWAGVCGIGIIVAFAHVRVWAYNYSTPELSDALGFAQISPALGGLQALLLAAIPVSLVMLSRRPPN